MYIRKSITFFLLVFLTTIMMFGCEEDPGVFVRPVNSNLENNNGIRVETCQEHQKCSGDDCCGKDSDCKNTCKELFEGTSYDICIDKYDKELVTQLEEVDKALDRPHLSNLNSIQTEPLCALLQLSSNKWLNKIKNQYTSGNAEVVFKWIFSRGILHLFSDTEDQLNIIKSLLVALANRRGQITDENILNGLTRQTIDGKKTIFYIADYAGQGGKVNFELIHNKLIVGDICDTVNNQPHPNAVGTRSGSESNCYYNDPNIGYQHTAATDYKEQACILALYCLAGHDNNSKAERREIAKNLVKDDEVTDFIATAVVSGGLGVTQEAEEWPTAACVELKNFWHNRSLNFNLGTAENFLPNEQPPCPR